MIELMIGLTVGLFVVLAALSAQIGIQASAGTLGDRAKLQDRAEAVLRNLALQIESSAALAIRPDTVGDSRARLLNNAFGIAKADTGNRAGLHVYGTDGNSSTDTLIVAYQHDQDSSAGELLDCTGTASPSGAGDMLQSRYWVASGGLLRCSGKAGTDVALAEGVEDFQVLYAVKSGGWTSRSLRWHDATQMTSGDLWPGAQAIELCLQVGGDIKGNPKVTDSRTGCNGQALPADGRIRVVTRRTITMRNVLLERD